jgi:hypothetical protein
MHQIPLLTNYRLSQIKLLKKRFIQANDLAKAVTKPLALTQFNNFLNDNNPVKFLIVRHPFDRLISAYRDKFEVFQTFAFLS